ncbi:hypothetical protein PRZ48_002805 [Zasmidium cellare]|uniref:Cyclin n=1 Tax=Zasmidium cellare TaxID=395010 RepID=A0ABR0ET96_ZASCE|nr:hypothetical protein PRZ48_002805 [Zasmidium cellare]
MTSTQRPLSSMYAASAIRFKDPFAVSKDLTPPKNHFTAYDKSRSAQSRYPDVGSPLTPPPEMNGVSQASKANDFPREHGHHYGDLMPAHQAYRAPVAPYLPQEVTNADFGRHGIVSQPNGRVSPVRQAQAEAVQPHRRPSQANSIAANFQIPRAVNDSGGSLGELAAQITCLFWFEPSELLQQVEDSPINLQPTRQLASDAKPTTGFRKWVATILTTTQVAQNVVVLALLFIYRLKKLNPNVRGKPGSEYRLLTVALMLGNKFLDDNTYTNKTWAEVSGINVGEVHIMEVEFLSNMKYNLFTSERDWARWQELLGKFASFFEKASRPPPPPPPAIAPILPPASSLHLPMALPSPPASTQASPPYLAELARNGGAYGNGQHGPTPAPSPLGNQLDPNAQAGSRKRSHDDYSTEPPPKRMATGYANYTSPQRYSTMSAQPAQAQPVPRLTLPSLSIPTSQPSTSAYAQPPSQGQQLPPLNMPARAMAMVYPTASSSSMSQQIPAAAPSMQPQSQYGSRHQSPYGGSGATSPTNGLPQSATALHPTTQISPTYFLQQRNSPYRPVHNVSTLLYPPPSAAMGARPPTVELNRMQYQPLGKPVQHSGRLPYVAQNLWLDGNQPQEMTPIHQWPGFQNSQQQSHLVPPQQ